VGRHDVTYVLVVDDDPTLLSVVSDTLDLEGYAVETATNGAEALTAAEREQPALVLLDMKMPVLDGWGFVREAGARGLQLPVVVMTAALGVGPAASAAEAVLPKPFDLEDLLAIVERYTTPSQ
jgi:CheY-like chemotaxis protein